MDNSEVQSILIYYAVKQTRYYICLSTFFCLCGYPVAGRNIDLWRCANAGDAGRNSVEGDFVIRLGEETEADEGASPNITVTAAEMECEGLLKTVLSEMLAAQFITRETYDVLDKIRLLYKEFELRKTEYNAQYYSFVSSEADKAETRYYIACSVVRKMQKDNPDDPILWHVRGMLMLRQVTLAVASEKPLPYNIPSVLAKLEEIAERNPGRYTLYALMGHLARMTKETKSKVPVYYARCIERAPEKDGIYLSDVYYKLAHWFDVRQDSGSALRYYKLSYRADTCNFRAAYKLARLAELKYGDSVVATVYYMSIRRMLEKVLSEKYLQPIEFEYLIKVYFCLKKIAQKKEDGTSYENGKKEEITYYETEFRKLTQLKVEDMKFFLDFYGRDAEKYFSYMMERVTKIRIT